MFKDYKLRNYDFKLIIMILALSVIGVFAVGSAEQSLQTKQLVGLIAGFVMMVGVSLFNYKWIIKLNWFMYIGNLLLLLLVKFLGDEGGFGAQRWLEIGTFRFQPSESAKILLILFFAQFIMKHKESFNTVRVLVPCLVLIIIPCPSWRRSRWDGGPTDFRCSSQRTCCRAFCQKS